MAKVPKTAQLRQPHRTCRCGACEPPKPKLPEGTRRLKVCYRWKANGNGQEPVILLQGEWLRKAGFEHGDEVIVTVTTKQLIVKFEKEQTS
ncbi:MAG: SymE family type I addiction module toxin [Bacteroidota bacterium]